MAIICGTIIMDPLNLIHLICYVNLHCFALNSHIVLCLFILYHLSRLTQSPLLLFVALFLVVPS